MTSQYQQLQVINSPVFGGKIEMAVSYVRNVSLYFMKIGSYVTLFLSATLISCFSTISCEPITRSEDGREAEESDLAGDSAEEPDFIVSTNFNLVSSWQGIEIIGDHIYIYGGDKAGMIQELDLEFRPTGWIGEYTVNGIYFVNHPIGLAYQPGYPTFIGKSGTISLIDWNQFYEDGNLDRALIHQIQHEAQDPNTRPEYVLYEGKWYVASARYDKDELGNEMILMDPNALSVAETIDDDGVIVYRFPVPSLVQDLVWSSEDNNIILVQNVAVFRGWKLTYIDLNEAIRSKDGMNDAVVASRCIKSTQEPHLAASELEGYAKTSTYEMFIIAQPDNNNNFFVALLNSL